MFFLEKRIVFWGEKIKKLDDGETAEISEKTKPNPKDENYNPEKLLSQVTHRKYEKEKSKKVKDMCKIYEIIKDTHPEIAQLIEKDVELGCKKFLTVELSFIEAKLNARHNSYGQKSIEHSKNILIQKEIPKRIARINEKNLSSNDIILREEEIKKIFYAGSNFNFKHNVNAEDGIYQQQADLLFQLKRNLESLKGTLLSRLLYLKLEKKNKYNMSDKQIIQLADEFEKIINGDCDKVDEEIFINKLPEEIQTEIKIFIAQAKKQVIDFKRTEIAFQNEKVVEGISERAKEKETDEEKVNVSQEEIFKIADKKLTEKEKVEYNELTEQSEKLDSNIVVLQDLYEEKKEKKEEEEEDEDKKEDKEDNKKPDWKEVIKDNPEKKEEIEKVLISIHQETKTLPSDIEIEQDDNGNISFRPIEKMGKVTLNLNNSDSEITMQIPNFTNSQDKAIPISDCEIVMRGMKAFSQVESKTYGVIKSKINIMFEDDIKEIRNISLYTLSFIYDAVDKYYDYPSEEMLKNYFQKTMVKIVNLENTEGRGREIVKNIQQRAYENPKGVYQKEIEIDKNLFTNIF